MNDENLTNGISDAHAFAVGQATGVNINGSHMGATGAALHNSSSMHNTTNNTYNIINNDNSFNKTNIKNNSYKIDEPNNNFGFKKTIVIFAIILVLGLVILFAFNTNLFSKIYLLNQSDKESIVTDKDYLYDKGIEYIKNKYHDLDTRREQDDYQVLVSYEKFGITKDDTYNYAYMWVLSESYFVKKDNLYQGRSNSSLYKIVFLNDEVIDYKMPENGKSSENAEYSVMNKKYDFADSLKKICPNKDIYNSIINYEVNLSNENQVKEHYSYVSDSTIYHENLGGGNSNNYEVVPYPNDKAHGGSGFVPR